MFFKSSLFFENIKSLPPYELWSLFGRLGHGVAVGRIFVSKFSGLENWLEVVLKICGSYLRLTWLKLYSISSKTFLVTTKSRLFLGKLWPQWHRHFHSFCQFSISITSFSWLFKADFGLFMNGLGVVFSLKSPLTAVFLAQIIHK